jgi:transglutaminase-like putative cysteine protease
MKHLRILLIAAALVSAFTVSVFAAEFYDVPKDAWFYSYVDELSDSGAINGVGGGCFSPASNVKHAEILKLVLSISGKEIKTLVNPGDEGYMWYSNILSAADEYGIAEMGTYDPEGYASREDVAGYIVKSMGWENASHPSDVFIDTDSDNAEILYQKDIVTGVAGGDGYSFNGDSDISRAETAALVYRTANYDCLELKQLTYLADAEGFKFRNPVEVSDWEKIIMYMGRNNLSEYTAIYSGDFTVESDEFADAICQNVLDAYTSCYERCNEYFCYYLNTSVESGYIRNTFVVKVTMKNSEFEDDRLASMRKEFFELAQAETEKLIEEGKITADMSEKEKAKAIFAYVCRKCSYDNSSANKIRHFGYSAVTTGKTVCQGYTNLLNTMLRSVGIWCESVPGKIKNRFGTDHHIWTRAMIDGEITYIDVTYADTANANPDYGDYSYFCVSKEGLAKDRIWNEDEVK